METNNPTDINLSKDFNIQVEQHAEAHKRYACPIEECKQEFSSSINLEIHMNCHQGSKLHKCLRCGKGFGRLSTLNCPKQSCLNLPKEYKCNNFYYKRRREGDIKIHQKSHSGDKPYLCEVCKKGFPGQSNLRVHKRT